MPRKDPDEFHARNDVVALAQRREVEVTIEKIAEDVGILKGCWRNWLRQDEIEAAKRRGATATASARLRELHRAHPAVGAGERGPATRRFLPFAD